jgi:hypothetical protein
MFGDSLEFFVPLAYLGLVSVLVGSVVADNIATIWKVASVCLIPLCLPFTVAVLLESSARSFFDRVGDDSRAAAAAATVSIAATLVTMLLLGCVLWWLGEVTDWIGFPEKRRSIWMCVAAIITLFSFGRFVVLHGREVDSLTIDLLLGVVGTWLVTKVIMVWAVDELQELLLRVNVVTLTTAISALLLSFVLLFEIVFGMGKMSSSDDIGAGEILRYGLSPWWIVAAFGAGCLGIGVWRVFYAVPRVVFQLFLAIWISVLLALFLLLRQGVVTDQFFTWWYTIACAGFAAEGYYRNSIGVPPFPRRRYTWGWIAFIFVSSGLGAHLTLSTVGSGFLLGIAACVLFVAAQGSICAMVLRVDLSTPGTSDATVRNAASNGWFRPVAQGVCQDSIVGGVLAVVFGYIPLISFSQVGLSTSFLSFLVFYSGFVAIGLGFIVLSDVEWLELCTRKHGYVYQMTPNALRKDSLKALKKHINFHVYWTLLSLLPIAVLQWIDLSLERALNITSLSTNVWSSVERLDDTDLDSDFGQDTPKDEKSPGEPDSNESGESGDEPGQDPSGK